MSIQYAAIARGPKILCHHGLPSGTNYDSLMTSILPNIPVGSNAKTSYTTNSETTVNVLVEGGLTFVCLCGSEVGKALPFEFLNEVKRQFTSTGLMHRVMHAGENEFDREFGPALSNIVDRYSLMEGSSVSVVGGGQLSTVQSQVEEVKGVMIKNIESVLARGQKLEDLMEKSADLEASASSFQKTAKKVRRKMWWKNVRLMLTLVLVGVIALIIIILIILFSTGVLPVNNSHNPTTTTTTMRTTTSMKL